MSQNVRYQFWILLAAGVIFFTCLGTAALWDEDETWYASCAREMMQRGDWVVPMFNGQVFPEKPPLMFWTMIAGFQLFGESELGARFFSAVFGVATALLTYHLGRKLFNDRVGFWGGLITASSIIFTVSARAATVDAALVLVTTAAVWCFVLIRGEWRGESGENLLAPTIRRGNKLKQYFLFLLFYIFLGLAVLAKGPIGFLLPMTALGLFLMIKNYQPKLISHDCTQNINQSETRSFFTRLDPFGVLKRVAVSFFSSLWQLRPITGIVVTMAVALPWYVMVASRTQGAWVQTFIFDFCIRPFTQPILGHSGPMWYYFPAVLIGFFPWSVFLGPMCVDVYRRIRANHPWCDGLVLLTCLFGVWFVFWSICSTKLPHYLLPVYPALSLLTACFLDGWIAEQVTVSRGWMRTTWISAILVGVGMTLALPIVAMLLLPGEEWIGAIGLILIFGGWLGLRFTAQGKRLQAVRCYGVASVAFLTAAFGFVTVGVDRHQNARPMMAAIHEDSPEGAAICEYGFHRKSSVYYAGHPIALCDDDAQLKKFLDSADRAYIITLADYAAEIEKKHPGEFEQFLRLHRFTSVAKPVDFEKLLGLHRFMTNKKPIEKFHAQPSYLVVLKRVGESPSVRMGGKPVARQVQ
jgi:4-amino-4-deoxy-L-arabinose transferase-like glycosyltransferase